MTEGVEPATRPQKSTAMEAERESEKDQRPGATGNATASATTPEMRTRDQRRTTSRCPITAKTNTRVATWNVRTLYQTGKLAQLLREFDNYRLNILGVNETRWTANGKIISDGKTFIYSGHDTNHAHGVGIVLSRRAAASLLSWNPVSNRIISARLQGPQAKTTIIQAYAPTEDADDADKDSFYEELAIELRRTPRHDFVILAGDFNAQIGPERQGFEHLIGPYGAAMATNENGTRLLTLCAAHGLAVENTYFSHKRIHKATWKAPGPQGVRNEIDYICVSKRWRSSVLDVRSFRGADIGTDHFLLIASCRLRLKRRLARPHRPKPLDGARLRDPTVVQQYKDAVRKRLEALATPADLETRWTQLRDVLVTSAEETVGRRRGTFKERWIQDRSWTLIDKRRNAKGARDQAKTDEERQAAESRYRDLDRQVKRSCRRDKREWVELKGAEAQKAAMRNDSRTLYRIVRELAGSTTGRGVQIRDHDGKVLHTQEEREQRWTEHFREILNQPAPTATFAAELLVPAPDLPIKLDRITLMETKQAIQALKNGKTAGYDGITSELLKAGDHALAEAMTELLNVCWATTSVPVDWKRGVIIALPKRGDLTKCDNWRGITLLSVPGKVLSIVLLNRLRHAVDEHLREQQAGFRSGRSCIEQIFVLRQVIEQTLEYQRRLALNFIDFTKAFDSIHRDTLWQIARSYGIPTHFIDLFRSLYQRSECCVRTDEGETNFFAIGTGVRQGCILSPMLFLLVIDFVCRNAIDRKQLGISWAGGLLADLDFADDVVLIAPTQPALKNLTTALEQQAANAGLRINVQKSKIVRVGYARTTAPMSINGQRVEEVSEFTYLGSVIAADGDTTRDVTCRIGKATATFQRLRPIWNSTALSTPVKLRILSATVIPTAIYASEAWKMTTTIARKIDRFHLRCLRRIMKISYLDRITNKEVYRRTCVRPLSETITQRRLRFAGHVLRLPRHRLPKTALTWRPTHGKRKQGRPRTTWRRTFTDDLRAINTSWDEIEEIAENRDLWKHLSALCADRRRWP